MNENTEVISTYSRKEAIEDGVLRDISETAKEAGFKVPVAMTSGLLAEIKPTEKDEGQDLEGRIWDMFTILMLEIRKGNGGGQVDFFFWVMRGRRKTRQVVKALCGPGDDMKPVITLMLPNED